MARQGGGIMLHGYCSQFLAYGELADFSAHSIQTLSIQLNELANFLKIQKIRPVKKVRYRHLIDFIIGDVRAERSQV